MNRHNAVTITTKRNEFWIPSQGCYINTKTVSAKMVDLYDDYILVGDCMDTIRIRWDELESIKIH